VAITCLQKEDAMAEDGKSGPGTSGSRRLDRNIDVLLQRREDEEKQSSPQEKVAQAITRFAGSMTFVYLHIVIFAVWIMGNLGFIPFFPVFDPSLVILAMEASVKAIFISAFVMDGGGRRQARRSQPSDLIARRARGDTDPDVGRWVPGSAQPTTEAPGEDSNGTIGSIAAVLTGAAC